MMGLSGNRTATKCDRITLSFRGFLRYSVFSMTFRIMDKWSFGSKGYVYAGAGIYGVLSYEVLDMLYSKKQNIPRCNRC